MFYEQYLTIWRDALVSLGLSLLSVAGVTYILTGEKADKERRLLWTFVNSFFLPLSGFNLIFALVVTFMVLLVVVNMAGVMWLWNITLNAVSLVNLVVVSSVEIFTIQFN